MYFTPFGSKPEGNLSFTCQVSVQGRHRHDPYEILVWRRDASRLHFCCCRGPTFNCGWKHTKIHSKREWISFSPSTSEGNHAEIHAFGWREFWGEFVTFHNFLSVNSGHTFICLLDRFLLLSSRTECMSSHRLRRHPARQERRPLSQSLSFNRWKPLSLYQVGCLRDHWAAANTAMQILFQALFWMASWAHENGNWFKWELCTPK